VLAVDRAGLIDGLAGSVDVFDAARAGAEGLDIPFAADGIANVFICGMGGSAVAGDLIASAYYERTRVPLVVHRGYYLPGWADDRTLAMLLSYSGETEETLTAAMQALERESPAIAITSGGKLDTWYNGKHGVPVLPIPGGLQPRMALLHMLIPAVVLLDETIGHMREKVLLPAKESLEIVNRKKPEEPAEHFLPYRNTPELVNPMPAFGSGYRYHVTGLAYDETGFPTNDTQTIADLMHRLNHKMVRFGPEMEQLETTEIKDADICLFAYGSVARSAKLAQRWGREKNIKVGLIKTSTLWPFPYDTLRKRLKNMRAVVAAEQNLGMITGELMKTVPFDRVFHVGRADGETLTPFQILAKIEEVAHAVAV